MAETTEVKNDKGMKVCRLICVSKDNNNKFYNMTQINDNEFEAEWGRVEGSTASKVYPMSKWDSTIKSKTKPSKKPWPYQDVTEMLAEAKDSGGKKGGLLNSDRPREVVKFVEHLMKLAKESVQRNYVVSSQSVTKAQVDEAQNILDEISKLLKVGAKVAPINEQLLALYAVIPRKMKKVQEHLLFGHLDEDARSRKTEIDNKRELDDCKKIFTKEQDALDVMAGQVAMNVTTDDGDDTSKEYDVLEAADLDMQECSPAEIKMIKKKLGPNANQLKRAFRVVNNKTEKNFKDFVKKAVNDKVDLLWHGSRNENWWSIFQKGLMIRPSNAVLTGAMFGNGVYFADKAQKSIGYTSMRGSYWASGSSSTGLLALYEIHQGRQKNILHWSSSHSQLDEAKMKREGFDSVFAKGGADLRNNEYITYNTNQSTIRYIVEVG